METLTRGILIAVEGIDGSGKSTLANKLRDSFQKEQFPTVLTYEPGDTKLGKQLRKTLEEKPVPVCGQAEFLLYAADRAQHFVDVVIPALTQKKIVISDRMSDSSLAYQGYGRNFDLSLITMINKWVMHDIKPDITLYIKISTK
ncbi:dTMP kinase, partial [bacterium]|nr:dTMP kinase [bacterium]